jgi:hypothetical protein
MIKEYEFQGYRAHILSEDDFEDIKLLSRSQELIRGMIKTPTYFEFFDKTILETLKSASDEKYIVGCRDKSGTLLNYIVFALPKTSAFMFQIFGETLKRNTVFSNSVDPIVSSKLMALIAEERLVFDQFVAVPTRQFFSLVRLFKKNVLFDEISKRYVHQLHSVVVPGQDHKTNIEKVLIKDNLLPYETPMAILHSSLKPEYRLEYYREHFNHTTDSVLRAFGNQF